MRVSLNASPSRENKEWESIINIMLLINMKLRNACGANPAGPFRGDLQEARPTVSVHSPAATTDLTDLCSQSGLPLTWTDTPWWHWGQRCACTGFCVSLARARGRLIEFWGVRVDLLVSDRPLHRKYVWVDWHIAVKWICCISWHKTFVFWLTRNVP